MLAAGLLAAAIAGVACTKNLLQGRGEFRFTISASKTGTKTSYSGQGTTQGDILTNERIDWTFGDLIRVYSPEAALPDDETVHFADYSVVEHPDYPGGLDGSDRLKSYAGLAAYSGSSLFNTSAATYHFFAAYPSPVTSGMPSGYSFQDGVFTGVIPKNQTVHQKSAGSYVYLPDMRLAYMLASSTVTITEEGQNIPLDFYPKFSAFEFTVDAGDYSKVTLRSMSLKSTAGYLAGTFSIAQESFGPTETGIPDDDISDSGTSITVDFGDSGIAVEKGHPVSITIITMAQSVSGLKVTFTGDEIGARSLLLKKADGSAISFGPYCKNVISGLRFPTTADAIIMDSIIWDGEYWSSVYGDVIAWDSSISFDATVPGGDNINWTPDWGLSGPFGGLYLSKGYLTQDASDKFTLSGEDQLEILRYYGESLSSFPIHYHQWDDMYEAAVDGFTVPTLDQWKTVIGYVEESSGYVSYRSGATVNGESGKHYSLVTIDLSGSDYESYGLSGGSAIKGLLLFPDNADILCPELSVFDLNYDDFTGTISYDRLQRLCEGADGCAFLPCAGECFDRSDWNNAGSSGRYWSSTLENSSAANCIDGPWTGGLVDRWMYSYPVRLVKDFN